MLVPRQLHIPFNGALPQAPPTSWVQVLRARGWQKIHCARRVSVWLQAPAGTVPYWVNVAQAQADIRTATQTSKTTGLYLLAGPCRFKLVLPSCALCCPSSLAAETPPSTSQPARCFWAPAIATTRLTSLKAPSFPHLWWICSLSCPLHHNISLSFRRFSTANTVKMSASTFPLT